MPPVNVTVEAAAPPAPQSPPRLTDDELAVIAVRLALRYPRWVERRVEHVAYLDDTTVRQRESVTLRWPEPRFFADNARPEPGQTIYVPLDLISKGPLIEVDVARPDGSTFAILSTRRNSELAAAGMTTIVWAVSEDTRDGEGLTDPTLDLIEHAVGAPAAQARKLLEALDDPTTEIASVLGQPDEYRGLLRELGHNFMLLAPARYEPGVETVLKYSYSQPLPWARSLRNVAATFGLADFRSELGQLSLGLGDSYHIEIAAPDEVRLARARLFGSYVDSCSAGRVNIAIAEDGDNPVVDLHARRPSAATLKLAEEYRDKAWHRRMFRRRPKNAPLPTDPLQAAIAVAPSTVARSDRGFAHVDFRLRVSGPFLAAVVTSLLTCALLLGARSRLVEIDGQIGAAVLLALPVVAAGYLTRPGEHAFATRLLGGVRFAALVVGVCSLLVAAILGGGFVDRPQLQPPLYRCAVTSSGKGVTRHVDCTPSGMMAPHATVPRDVRRAVDWATYVACGFTGLLLIGLLRSWTWPTVRLQREPGHDDHI
jgi:hypothetical protein